MKWFDRLLIGFCAVFASALLLRADIISPMPYTFVNGQVITVDGGLTAVV